MEPAKNKGGRPRGRSIVGEPTAREHYYAECAEEKRLKNAKMRGELVPVGEVKATWALEAMAVREAVLNIVAVAIQRGVVGRDKEADLREIVKTALRSLKDG